MIRISSGCVRLSLVLAAFAATAGAQIDTAGLVAYYPFPGDAGDYSGHGHHGTVHGATLSADRFGNPDRAYLFDGTDDYIEVPYSAELNPTARITVSAWVKADAWGFSGFDNYVVSTEQNTPNQGYTLRGGATSVTFMISGGGAWRLAQTGAGTIDSGNWHHLVGVYDGSQLLTYIDGVQRATASYAGAILPSTGALLIGTSPGSYLRWFDGAIDDIRVFTRALDATEVTALYGEGETGGLPQPISPAWNQFVTSHTVPLLWHGVDSATAYRVQVSPDSTFGGVEHEALVAAPDTADTAVGLLFSAYYWRVRAYLNGGDSTSWSWPAKFRVDSIPPAPPALVFPSQDTVLVDSLPRFHWDQVATGVWYRIMIAGDSLFAVGIDSALVDSCGYRPNGGIDDGTYYWRVQASDSAGNWSQPSVGRRFRIEHAFVPVPIAPAQDALFGTTTIGFLWHAAAAAAGYGLQVAVDSGFATPEVDTVIAAPDTGTTITVALPQRYYWRVRTCRLADTSYWCEPRSFRIDTVPPAAPVPVAPSNGSVVSDSQPRFHWSEATSAVRYRIRIASDSLLAAVVDSATVDTCGYRPGAALADGLYYWGAQAADSAGNWSQSSLPWSLTVDTFTPVLLSPGDGAVVTAPRPAFDWQDSRAATGYTIEIARDSLFTDLADSATVMTSGFAAVDALPDTAYHWRVRAYGVSGDTSQWSVVWCFAIDTSLPGDSLVAYYPFSGNAGDYSGHGHHGTVYGAAPAPDRFGNPGRAYSFDGVNDYIEVPYSAELNPTDRITVAAWVRADAWGSSDNSNAIVNSEQNGPNHGYGLRGGASRITYFVCTTDWRIATTPYSSVVAGRWYFLVGSYDGTAVRVFIDGVQAASSAASGAMDPSTSVLRIGAQVNSLCFFDGAIDDIRIYARALDTADISALYHEGGYTGVGALPPSGVAPVRSRLWQARPNPATARAVICYELAEPAAARVEVFNIAGQRMATLVDGRQRMGSHAVSWDLADDAGRPVANGVYFYKLSAGAFHSIGKLTVVR